MQYIDEEDKSLIHKGAFYWKNILIIGVLLIYELGFRSSGGVGIEIAAVIILLVLFQPIYSKIQIMFFLIPFTTVLVIASDYSLVSIIQLIIIIALLIKFNSVNRTHIFFLVVYFSIQLLSTLIYEADILQNFSLMITLLSVSLYTEMFNTSKQDLFPLLAKSLVFGIIIASSIPVMTKVQYIISGGYIGRFSGLWDNANIYGMQLLVGIALTISLLFEKKVSKLLGVIILVLLCFFLVMTYSRTAIFGLSIMLVISLFMYLFGEDSPYKLLKNMVAIGFFIIVLYLAFIFIVEPIIERRGLVSSGDDISSGRFTLAENNFKWIVQEKKGIPLFLGLGLNNNIDYMKRNGYITDGTHNTYLEMLISSGYFGFLAWAVFLGISVGKSTVVAIKSRRLYVYVILLYTFTAHLHTTTFVYMLLTLVSLNPRSIDHKQRQVSENSGLKHLS